MSTGKCYSLDDEDFRFTGLGELFEELAANGELEVGQVYYEADCRGMTADDVVDSHGLEWLLDEMDGWASEALGEVYDNDCSSVSGDAKGELHGLIRGWLDKHVALHRYHVIEGNTRKFTITEDDLKGNIMNNSTDDNSTLAFTMTSNTQEIHLISQEPDMSGTVSFFPHPGKEVMRLSSAGMTYKGQHIEDGGEAYSAFMEVMRGLSADPNNAWLSEAHALCSDHGIPHGHMADRIRALREKLSEEQHHGLDTADSVCFYEQDFYVLSNFSSFTLEWNAAEKMRFDTSEAAYHWEKFPGHDDIRAAIINAPSAHEAFKIAERNKTHRRADWDEVKVGIMSDILRAKVDQHEYVRRKLLATGDRELIENSWRDDFWGWGPSRDGQNMLGKLWMEVRAELRAAIAADRAARGGAA